MEGLSVKKKLFWFFVILSVALVFVFLHNAIGEILGESSLVASLFFILFFVTLVVDIFLLLVICLQIMKKTSSE